MGQPEENRLYPEGNKEGSFEKSRKVWLIHIHKHTHTSVSVSTYHGMVVFCSLVLLLLVDIGSKGKRTGSAHIEG